LLNYIKFFNYFFQFFVPPIAAAFNLAKRSIEPTALAAGVKIPPFPIDINLP